MTPAERALLLAVAHQMVTDLCNVGLEYDAGVIGKALLAAEGKSEKSMKHDSLIEPTAA